MLDAQHLSLYEKRFFPITQGKNYLFLSWHLGAQVPTNDYSKVDQTGLCLLWLHWE